MKNKIIIIAMLMVIFLIPLVSAEPEYFFKKGTDIDLKINCFENNLTICGASTNCYITINYPDTTNLVNNGTMQNSNTYFNYTIPSARVDKVGEYAALAYCTGDEDGYTIFTFEVSKEGSRLNSYIFLTLILIFIYLIIWFGASQDEKVLTTIGAMGLVVLGVYMHMNGYGDVKSWISDMFAFINIMIGSYIFIKVWGEEAVHQLGG